MVALTLEGHEETLFKQHISFKNASKHMNMLMSKPFRFKAVTKTFNVEELKKSWNDRGSTILEGLWNLKYAEDEVANELKIGSPYVMKLLRLFINKIPVLSFQEVQLERNSKKDLVGGAIDLAVGCRENGKPSVKIKDCTLFLGSLAEAKGADIPLARKKKELETGSKDIKIIIQPAMEVMAVSQLAEFPDSPNSNKMPLINILASKNTFRPLFYWKEFDFLMTTAKVVPLRPDQNKIDIRGLLLLFTTFQVYCSSCLEFDDEVLGNKPKSGWQEALKGCKDSYEESELTLGKPRTRRPHVGAEYYTVDSSR